MTAVPTTEDPAAFYPPRQALRRRETIDRAIALARRGRIAPPLHMALAALDPTPDDLLRFPPEVAAGIADAQRALLERARARRGHATRADLVADCGTALLQNEAESGLPPRDIYEAMLGDMLAAAHKTAMTSHARAIRCNEMAGTVRLSHHSATVTALELQRAATAASRAMLGFQAGLALLHRLRRLDGTAASNGGATDPGTAENRNSTPCTVSRDDEPPPAKPLGTASAGFEGQDEESTRRMGDETAVGQMNDTARAATWPGDDRATTRDCDDNVPPAPACDVALLPWDEATDCGELTLPAIEDGTGLFADDIEDEPADAVPGLSDATSEIAASPEDDVWLRTIASQEVGEAPAALLSDAADEQRREIERRTGPTASCHVIDHGRVGMIDDGMEARVPCKDLVDGEETIDTGGIVRDSVPHEPLSDAGFDQLLAHEIAERPDVRAR